MIERAPSRASLRCNFAISFAASRAPAHYLASQDTLSADFLACAWHTTDARVHGIRDPIFAAMLASLFLLLPNLLRAQTQGVKAKMVEWRPVANRLATLGVRTSLRGLTYLHTRHRRNIIICITSSNYYFTAASCTRGIGCKHLQEYASHIRTSLRGLRYLHTRHRRNIIICITSSNYYFTAASRTRGIGCEQYEQPSDAQSWRC